MSRLSKHQEKDANKWYKDKLFLGILLVVLSLSILNLGDRPFWGDEVHLINFGKTIIKYGLPVVDNELKNIEATYEVDDITGQGWNADRLHLSTVINGREVYTLHPWLTSYIVAIMMWAFGPFNEFLIRLPFVLFGIMALIPTYLLAMRITGQRDIARLSTLLLGSSVVFLLAIRSANYYGIIILCTPVILLSYMDVQDGKRNAWWKFGLSSSVLFHAQWLVFFSIMFGIAVHFIIYLMFRKGWMKSATRMILPLTVTVILTLPWFYMTEQFEKSSVLPTLSQYMNLLSIGTYHILTWFIPLIIIAIGLLIIYMLYAHKKKNSRKDHGSWLTRIWSDSFKYSLLIIPFVTSLILLSLNYYTGTPIRYFYSLLPSAMIINAGIIYLLYNSKIIGVNASKILAVLILIMMMFTNVIHVAPLIPFKGAFIKIAGSEDVLSTGKENQMNFFEKSLRFRTVFLEYVNEITNHVQSSTQEIIDYIGMHGYALGSNIFIAAGDPNTIGYYTRMRPATVDNNFGTRDYDWIILPMDDQRNKAVNLKIYSQSSGYLQPEKWGDTADPVHHLFKTTQARPGEGFYIYNKIN
jgi:hypothetical protein